MAKYTVHYESIVQEKYFDEIEADSLEEAEAIAQAFCDEGDTSLFELDCVIGGGDKDEHPSIYSITKEGDEEVGRYATEIVHHSNPAVTPCTEELREEQSTKVMALREELEKLGRWGIVIWSDEDSIR